MTYWKSPLIIYPVILINTDDKADYHTKEKYWLCLTNSSTFSPHIATIEDDKLYPLISGQYQIDTYGWYIDVTVKSWVRKETSA